MGYQIVTVLLADGREFRRVLAANGELKDKAGSWVPPFKEDEILDLVVTHDKSGPPVEVKKVEVLDAGNLERDIHLRDAQSTLEEDIVESFVDPSDGADGGALDQEA